MKRGLLMLCYFVIGLLAQVLAFDCIRRGWYLPFVGGLLVYFGCLGKLMLLSREDYPL